MSFAPSLPICLRSRALAALRECDPAVKAATVRALYASALDGTAICTPSLELARDVERDLEREPGEPNAPDAPDAPDAPNAPDAPDAPAILPGRPTRPELVEPRKLGRRSMQSPEGRAVLLHALAHIEFNAINLALDAVWRFPGLPVAFYTDWLKVAAEEAHHFSLLVARLAQFDHAYGDFPAHDGLWDMCERTRGDVLARMALVPRTLEARGLDASPPIRARLQQAGDHASAAILDVILRDEIGHVLIGNRWFRHLCAQDGLDPHVTYARLADQYHAPKLRGPFNFEARREAGFDEAELAELTALAGLAPLPAAGD